MRRRDWLLAFLGAEPAGGWRSVNHRRHSLDPIRVMKGLFLAQQEDREGSASPADVQPYTFRPYAYGPFTAEVYYDLDVLLKSGLVEQEPVPGKTYTRWRLTEVGWQAAARALAALSPDERARMERAKELVVFNSFTTLLRHVYREFPEYATESVVSRLRD